jgi:hypothetical protein
LAVPPPPLNNAAHRFFHGRYHLFDRHVAVSLRHGHVALRKSAVGPVDVINPLSQALLALPFLLEIALLERLFRQVRIPRPARR